MYFTIVRKTILVILREAERRSRRIKYQRRYPSPSTKLEPPQTEIEGATTLHSKTLIRPAELLLLG